MTPEKIQKIEYLLKIHACNSHGDALRLSRGVPLLISELKQAWKQNEKYRAVLKSLNVQAIVNGQAGNEKVIEKIKSALGEE